MPPKIASFLKRPGLTPWPSSGGAASSGSSAFFGFLAMRPPTPWHENAAGRGRPLFGHWPVTVNGALSRWGAPDRSAGVSLRRQGHTAPIQRPTSQSSSATQSPFSASAATSAAAGQRGFRRGFGSPPAPPARPARGGRRVRRRRPPPPAVPAERSGG